MEQASFDRSGTCGFSRRKLTAGVLAVGGLTASLFVGGSAIAVAVPHEGKGVVVSAVKNKKLGTLLISGTPVYTLKPSSVACTAKCLQTWPPVTLPKGTTKATVGAGVTASKLGTMKRSNGVVQVTYAGKALYRFIEDKAAEQVNGNVRDTWGTWTDVVTVKPANSSSGSGSTSGGNTGTGGVAF